MRVALGLLLLALAGCDTGPKLVMINPHTGATVDCSAPDPSRASGAFLVSRACLSACQAHGFRPVPGLQTDQGSQDIPSACMN